MVPLETPSRRPIVIGVLAASIGLVLIGALAPSLTQRQAEEKRRVLVSLRKIRPPQISPDPAISITVHGTPSEREGRAVTIHAYVKLGVMTTRYELLQAMGPSGRDAVCRTVFHLRFDPKEPNEVRVATAIAASASTAQGLNLRQEALGGPLATSKHVLHLAGLAEKGKGKDPLKLAAARDHVLSELSDGSASAYPVGTVIYEVDGRFYLSPKLATTPARTPGVVTSPDDYQILDAIVDPDVRLP